jgi:hypothetical protein
MRAGSAPTLRAAKGCSPQADRRRPEGRDDDWHRDDQQIEHAERAECRPQRRDTNRSGNGALAAIDRLHGEVGAAEPQSGEAKPGDDRVGAQLLDD